MYSPKLIEEQFSARSLLKLNIPESRQERLVMESTISNLLALSKTRLFLTKVVDSTKYQFHMENASRYEACAWFDYTSDAVPGFYTIKIDTQKQKAVVFFSDPKSKAKIEKSFNPFSVKKFDTLSINGISIVFNPDFLTSHEQAEFELVFFPKRSAINVIREGLISIFSPQNQFITFEYSDKDRYLARDVVNTISRLIIEENLHLKTLKIQTSLKNLEEQLRFAENQLKKAEYNLRVFRQKNPTVSLPGEAVRNIDEIDEIESAIEDSRNRIEKIKTLTAEISSTGKIDEKIVKAQDLLDIINQPRAGGQSSILTRFNNAVTEYSEMIGQYPAENPIVRQEAQKLNDIIKEIVQLANSKKVSEEKELRNNEYRLTQYTKQLKELPRAELELAKLVREQQIVEQAYVQTKQQYNETKVAAAVETPDIYLIDEAVLPDQSITQKKQMLVRYSSVVMVLVTFLIGIPFLMALVNRKVIYLEELEDRVKFPFISQIPVIGELEEVPEDLNPEAKLKLDPKLVTLNYSPNYFNENFRKLRSSLIAELNHFKDGKVILGLSYYSGEGKSLIMSNLAITFAQNKIKTLLVDADIRRGVLHNTFITERAPGLSNALSPMTKLTKENVYQCIQNTPVPNLLLMPCGDPIPNPSEMLGSKKMADLMKLLREDFEVILIDSPPFSMTSDPLSLIYTTDRTLIIMMAGRNKLSNIEEMVHTIERVKPNSIIALVLNGVENINEKNKYTYSYYNY
jgi:tyrosine-protein kinase Etk/Wzc